MNRLGELSTAVREEAGYYRRAAGGNFSRRDYPRPAGAGRRRGDALVISLGTLGRMRKGAEHDDSLELVAGPDPVTLVTIVAGERSPDDDSGRNQRR